MKHKCTMYTKFFFLLKLYSLSITTNLIVRCHRKRLSSQCINLLKKKKTYILINSQLAIQIQTADFGVVFAHRQGGWTETIVLWTLYLIYFYNIAFGKFTSQGISVVDFVIITNRFTFFFHYIIKSFPIVLCVSACI